MKYTTLVLFFAALALSGCSKQESATPPGTSSTDARADSMKQAMNGIVAAINTNKLDELDKFIASDMLEHASLTAREAELQVGWLKGIKELIADEMKESPDNKYVVEDIVTEGNICVCRTLQSGTKMVDSAGVKLPKMQHRVNALWMRWENGKFVEIWDTNKKS
jgi:hypothetical protein